MKIKEFFINLLFPKFCLSCKKEGNFLCEDCFSILDIYTSHQKMKTQNLDDIYFAVNYENFLVKKLIQSFKYPPLIKELKKELALIIFFHLSLLDRKPNFSSFKVISIPSGKSKLRWRGFNPAQEIAKELSQILNLNFISDGLIKIKENKEQVNLSEKERLENVKGVFGVKNREMIEGKNILLIDDVFTTGATLEEGAKVLKEAGAKKIIGMVVAKATLDKSLI